MRTKHWRAAIPEAIVSRGVKRRRLGLGARRAAELSMRAFGRRKQRALSVGGVAVALAASLAGAEVAPVAGPVPADRGARLPLLSPAAALSFGEVGDASPLIAVFNAARAAETARRASPVHEPEARLHAVGEIALDR